MELLGQSLPSIFFRNIDRIELIFIPEDLVVTVTIAVTTHKMIWMGIISWNNRYGPKSKTYYLKSLLIMFFHNIDHQIWSIQINQYFISINNCCISIQCLLIKLHIIIFNVQNFSPLFVPGLSRIRIGA